MRLQQKLISLTLALLTTITLLSATQSGPAKVMFEAAKKMEVVDGDLNAAIQQYKAVVARYPKERAIVADALIHMADCYQKLGDVESQKIYQRIVREYSDQKDASTLAQARLRGTLNAKREQAVWTGPKVDSYGRVSRDGRFITFVDWNDGRLMIHEIAANTNRALTPAAPNYSQNALSSAITSDGKQIVYEWLDESQRTGFRIAPLQGSGFLQPRQLFLANDDIFSLDSFDVSPDRKWIAVAIRRKDGTSQIALIGMADGSFRVLKSTPRILYEGRTPPERIYSIFFSPDSRNIAYGYTAGDGINQSDVFVLSIGSGHDIPAVVQSANDSVMGWSPDGTRLLFSSDRTGSVGLYALSFEDEKAQGLPVLLKPDVGRSVPLGLTASGAIYVYKQLGTREVAIAPIDLDAGKLLGPPVGFTQGFIEDSGPPHWSPDGKYLTYQVPCNNGCVAIRTVATGQVRRLASTLTNARGVMWSPDGRSLLTKGADRSGREGIFQIDIQSGEATAVTLRDGLTTLAQWSPDSKKVYFNPDGLLVERDLASGVERNIYDGARNGAISPDGQYFAVAGTDLITKSPTLLLVPVSGGPPRELLHLRPTESLARVNVWTPDSRAIIVTKDNGSHGELWLVPVTGDRLRKLEIDPDTWSRGSSELQAGFSLSPDGRSIAGQIGKIAAEVWALENFLPAPPAKK